MIAVLQRIIGELDEVLTRVDPDALHARDAATLLDAFISIERRAVSGRTLLADRAVDAGDWTRGGYRSPEEWLANKTGTGFGEAKSALETSQKLKALPSLGEAVRDAKLSANQLNNIGPAATPENENRLLGAAKSDSAAQLRERCAKEKARVRSEEEERARYERVQRNRHFRSWTTDGVWRCEGEATPDVGARIDAAVAAEAERVFKAAYAEGRREQTGAYRLDALVNLIDGGGAAIDTEVVIRVDESRLRGEEGICETVEGSPLPVDVVIGAILAGAFVKLLATNGVDVSSVSHDGRHVPEVLRTAVQERDGWRCVRPGCGGRHRLQTHHYRIDYGKRGPTAYWNLATLCKFDHDLVTHRGHRLEGGPGAWQWIEPP